MNRKLFLIIISSVTVLCIILGACIHLGHAWSGSVKSVGKSVSKAVRQGIKVTRSYDFHIDDDEDELDIDIDDEDAESGTKNFSNTLSQFDSVEIDANVMGVKIERGNSFEISGSYTKTHLKPNVNITGGTLRISQPDYRRNRVTNGNCKIVITVPFGTRMDSFNAGIDVGAVSLKGIDIEDIQIKTDVGAIAVENVKFNELNATSDVGAVSVELTDSVNEYNIDIKSDVGGIQVDNRNVKRKYSQSGSTNKKIKIRTDVGGIEVK